MSHLKIVLALASSSALLLAQGNKGSADRMVNVSTAETTQVERNQIGNEKTVGAVQPNNQFRAAADSNAIGNAKTVGGIQTEAYVENNKGVGTVGNSKTVGEQ